MTVDMITICSMIIIEQVNTHPAVGPVVAVVLEIFLKDNINTVNLIRFKRFFWCFI